MSTIEQWFESFAANEDNLWCLEFQDLSDDGGRLTFSSGDESIDLLMPPVHPKYTLSHEGEDKFIAEIVRKTTAWIKSQASITSAISILNEIAAIGNALSEQGGVSEDDGESMTYDEDAHGNDQSADMDVSNTSTGSIVPTTWLDEHNFKRRLIEKEAIVRAEQLASSIGRATTAVDNIFSAEVTSKVLIGDLLQLMKDSSDLGFEVEAIDDNIYSWRVKILKFEEESDLTMELLQLEDNFGYAFVEIQLSFAMDVYPFYPPLVTIIRPKFEGFMLGHLATLECLKLSQWDPVHGLRNVLRAVKKEIAGHGHIELASELNDAVRYPSGSYSHLEHLLLKLGMVTETIPRIQTVRSATNAASAAMVEAATIAMKENASAAGSVEQGAQKAAASAGGWAKGTGYGHGRDHKDWDIKQYLAAQHEKDRLQKSILQEILGFLMGIDDSAFEGPIQRWVRIVEESCLVPLLEQYITDNSFMEMERHLDMFSTIFEFLKLFLRHPDYHGLMLPLACQKRSLQLLLLDLKKVYDVYHRQMSKGGDKLKARAVPVAAAANVVETTSTLEKSAEESILRIVQEVTDEAERFTALYHDAPLLATSGASDGGVACVAAKKHRGPDAAALLDAGAMAAAYTEAMKDLQYQESDVLAGYHYQNDLKAMAMTANNRKRNRRLGTEHADLSNSLPLAWSSSVWIRASSERMDAMQAIISGPEDTPYWNGLFLFDIFFPEAYPSGPPKVNLQTTGRGSVRFNPNLYNCGKVCLSLLGTWQGQASESWNEDISTFRQVLLSIQSLILVPDPFFNEPGYEKTMGTPQGIAQSRAYNEVIESATIRWAMIDHLENPKVGFEEIIRTHFRLKKEEILKQVQGWITNADARSSVAHSQLLQTLHSKLAGLLGKL